jgi:hypothetical protein
MDMEWCRGLLEGIVPGLEIKARKTTKKFSENISLPRFEVDVS